ncbi:SDR family NAD(P)-dependent oxidoreductase [Dictyobacter kobayashii]|uniref:Oxidoreductase n=1 Tax=Dictyobacter kobayashii TaxID=2014872 RepID=A0A402AJK5_9CHLR|nr:SDR family NAD(P)-dependent oxidoreductase [Dictyobacter kobayashii]GCE19259.1 oxidoreductase [Dictyobacter kobayashii]
MANSLQGKVALITGASSGIGEASALSLAAEGAHVAVVARRGDRLQELIHRIHDLGGQALPIVADVADEQQVKEMVKHVKNKLGRIDILVNNAGVMLLGQIDGANTEDWRRMVAINVMGLMYTTHAVLPIMKEQNRGHIVNISSVAGRVARAGSGVYNVTKWGVVAFSEALRQESYKNNIRVTVIEPGAVATELTDHITDENAKKQQGEWLQGLTPLESEDIAAAIVYAVTQPERVNVNEILIRPTGQDR